MAAKWTPDSWRAHKGIQMPAYRNAEALAAVEAQLGQVDRLAVEEIEVFCFNDVAASMRKNLERAHHFLKGGWLLLLLVHETASVLVDAESFWLPLGPNSCTAVAYHNERKRTCCNC